MEKRELKTLREVLRGREKLLETELSVVKEVDETYRYLYSALNLNPKSIGRVLTKIGITLMIFPEPFISHLIGCIFLGTGLLIDRSRKPYLMEVRKEFSRSMELIKLFREEINLNM